MTESNLLKIREPRCSVCKRGDDELAALHRDRFEGMLPFEGLAAKYGLSDAAVRRHIRRHATAPEDEPISELGHGDVQANAEETDSTILAGETLDAHGLLENGTKHLAEIVQALAEEYRAAVSQQRPQAADRVFAKFMKAQAELARCVKQVQAGRVLRDEFRKSVPHIVARCTSAASRAILPLMRENAKVLREAVVEFSNGTLSADDFWMRLVRYEVEWPKDASARMRVATTEALKIEEAKLKG